MEILDIGANFHGKSLLVGELSPGIDLCGFLLNPFPAKVPVVGYHPLQGNRNTDHQKCKPEPQPLFCPTQSNPIARAIQFAGSVVELLLSIQVRGACQATRPAMGLSQSIAALIQSWRGSALRA